MHFRHTVLGFLLLIGIAGLHSCQPAATVNAPAEDEVLDFYPTSKPCTRWWWFATEIKKPDIKYQLDWAKKNNFGACG